MLRGLRRRINESRTAPRDLLTFRVQAVSPHPEEPEGDEHYRPPLIVSATPEPDAGTDPEQFAIGALLFVEWADARLDDRLLALRLQALIPRLRLAVRQGLVGPARYAEHRARQQGRYYLHREAATYEAALHSEETGLYLAVKRRVLDGPWQADKTLLEAATLAPYEALLRLDPAASARLLAWLERATTAWLAGHDATFPRAEWAETGRLGEPGDTV
jgi:hypothetical protein